MSAIDMTCRCGRGPVAVIAGMDRWCGSCAVENLPAVADRLAGHGLIEYHHHTDVDDDVYLRAADAGEPMRALCGVLKVKHPNPLSLPCCPDCAFRMAVPCLGAVA